MKISKLQDNLRKTLLKRVDAGDLTQLRLAEMTGFQQAHISNFLNRKRSLSMEGFDNLLRVSKLSVLDLMDPDEVSKRATLVPPAEQSFENVVLTTEEAAAQDALISARHVHDILKFKKAFLRRLRPALAGSGRGNWQRFVLIKVDAEEAMSMYPRMTPGATVLLDRHYNSLEPYRKGERSIFAVKKSEGCTIKYVERAGANLVLRPENQEYPIDVLPIEPGASAAEMIVGRVCHVAIET